MAFKAPSGAEECLFRNPSIAISRIRSLNAMASKSLRSPLIRWKISCCHCSGDREVSVIMKHLVSLFPLP
jgi:hypothetical protein